MKGRYEGSYFLVILLIWGAAIAWVRYFGVMVIESPSLFGVIFTLAIVPIALVGHWGLRLLLAPNFLRRQSMTEWLGITDSKNNDSKSSAVVMAPDPPVQQSKPEPAYWTQITLPIRRLEHPPEPELSQDGNNYRRDAMG